MGDIVEPHAVAVASAIHGAGAEGLELVATSPPTVHDRAVSDRRRSSFAGSLMLAPPAEGAEAITVYGPWPGKASSDMSFLNGSKRSILAASAHASTAASAAPRLRTRSHAPAWDRRWHRFRGGDGRGRPFLEFRLEIQEAATHLGRIPTTGQAPGQPRGHNPNAEAFNGKPRPHFWGPGLSRGDGGAGYPGDDRGQDPPGSTASRPVARRRWRIVDRLGEQFIRDLLRDSRTGATPQKAVHPPTEGDRHQDV